ncbi:MAG: hypothetical protein LBG49_01295 [Mycoplasmataceae bacterium]|nr:hypothetical protein [Mycoplasmataceae bacterium]
MYWNQTHELSGAVTSRIVDYSSITTTKTAGDVLASLSTQNSSFHPDAVEIGYTSQSTFYSYTLSTQMTQTNLTNLWKDIGNSNGYGYELTLQAKTGGWYSGSTNINIYVKLKRISFNPNLFGNDRSLNDNGGANPFITIPNLEQATRAWITRYNSTAFNDGTAAWANFYTSNTSNCNLEIDTGKLKLQYGDANQFYTSDSGTATFFTFNVQQKESLVDVFENNDHTTSIPTDTATNNLIYINKPLATHECWVDTIILLKEQYSDGTYSDFRGADFTSMYIYSVSFSNGTTGFNGTLTVSPLTGSLFYEDTVTLYWKTYNYTA